MSYNNPTILTIPVPTGLDRAIESIRESLSVLPWLEKSFGRAWEFPEVVGETVQRVPKVFLGNNGTEGEYHNVLPNDNFTFASFIAVRGPEKWLTMNRGAGDMKQRSVSVIFWGNLKQVDSTKNYIFTEELKKDVEQILSVHENILSIDEYVDERATSVFDGYDVNAQYGSYSVDDSKEQLMMYPYGGFRFDLTLNYPSEC